MKHGRGEASSVGAAQAAVEWMLEHHCLGFCSEQLTWALLSHDRQLKLQSEASGELPLLKVNHKPKVKLWLYLAASEFILLTWTRFFMKNCKFCV